jgi:large subunit ribosomal protein L6
MIKVPEKAKVSVHGTTVVVEGPKGKLERNFSVIGLKIESSGGFVTASSTELMITNTVESHVKNMLIGVTDGYSRKMQVIYSHFPLTVEVKGQTISIKNFQGEKKPRRANIAGNTKVEVKGQEVFISGIDKEAVGQTIANIMTATKIKKRDSRVFQDGLYQVDE